MKKRRVLAMLLTLCLTVGTANIPVHASVQAGDAGSYSAEETEVVEETEEIEETKVIEETEEASYYLFTDDTGMEITFEVLADSAYQYEIENGILKSIRMEDGSLLSGNVDIPADKGITAIGANAFGEGSQITYVKLPEGVTVIEAEAFANLNKLQSVYLPEGVESIGEGAFKNCKSFSRLAIPKSVKSIGDKAFAEDEILYMVYMKDINNSTLESIGNHAFDSCKALSYFCSDSEFVIPQSLKSIGDYAFAGCKKIKGVSMPDSMVSLGAGAFSMCESMESLVLSDNLTDIPEFSFDGCSRLMTVTFKSGNRNIGYAAFRDCISLTKLDFQLYISSVGEDAFSNCTNLLVVECTNGMMEIGRNAFPNSENLTFYGIENSTMEKYTWQEDCKIKFVSIKGSQGTFPCIVDSVKNGTISVRNGEGTIVKEAAAGTVLYIFALPEPADKYVLEEGSVKINGETAVKWSPEETYYAFKMPVGGVHITATFKPIVNTEKIVGTDDKVHAEVSFGGYQNPNNEKETILVELKAGQLSRMFLVDEKDDNKVIDSAKITFSSDKQSVATIDANGLIRAVKAGECYVTATCTGADGKKIERKIRVIVSPINVEKIDLIIGDYNKDKVSVDLADEIGLVEIEKAKLDKGSVSFTITAIAYDEENDNSQTNLKWTTSDANVASIRMTDTLAQTPKNYVSIPQGATGEATITITATNADNTKVTKKLVVSIKDYTPRVVENTITINMNSTKKAYLSLIKAYGRDIVPANVKLLDEKSEKESGEFFLKYAQEMSDEDVFCFAVEPIKVVGLGSYNLILSVNDFYKIKITVKVVKKEPNPQVSISAKQQKINLFYGNDKTQIVPVINGLNGEEVSGYSLEALSNSEDDKLFLENFTVDPTTGVITQKSDSMKYTSAKKPAVTGYLVLKFAGYDEKVAKKYKITIPTTTIAPSYGLNKTTDTFNAGCAAQDVRLTLLDKKNKNTPLVLDEHYRVKVLPTSVDSIASDPVIEDGQIVLKLKERCIPGKIYLEVTNDTWASDKSFKFTYTIRTVTAEPKISLVKSSLAINALYPEQVTQFAFKSNQGDTDIAKTQIFTAASTPKNAAEYAKLSVVYENGIGTVKVLDSSIAKGTYTFNCNQVKRLNARGEEVSCGKVTLRITVNKNLPTVKITGKASLNIYAMNEAGKYGDVGTFSFTAANLPGTYTLDSEETLKSISCTTNGYAGYEGKFNWKCEDNKISVSLANEIPNKSYAFTVVPVYTNGTNKIVTKAVKFNVTATKNAMSVTMTGKGTINLLDRNPDTYTDKNSVIYTAKLKNFNDAIKEVRVYDAGSSLPTFSSEVSSKFKAVLVDGKVHVVPIDGAMIESGKAYQIKLWAKFENTAFAKEDGYGIWIPGVFTIKTTQVLPKATASKSDVNFYLANKNYATSFVIKKQNTSDIGNLIGVKFADKDTAALNTFYLEYEELENGDLFVRIRLKDTVSYVGNTTNRLTLYAVFDNQGSNTDGSPVYMNVRINK